MTENNIPDGIKEWPERMNENNNDLTDAIFTPHYRGDKYLHHVCSCCGYKVNIRADVWNPLYFGETFRFCPNCGKTVVRFANLPVFEEPPFNPVIFEPIEKIREEYEDKVKHYLYIQLSDEERKELLKKAELAECLQESGGPVTPLGAKIILKHGRDKLSHWDKKKLQERIKRGG